MFNLEASPGQIAAMLIVIALLVGLALWPVEKRPSNTDWLTKDRKNKED